MAGKKHYVQFSKKIVVAVCICVTAVVICGISMAFSAGDVSEITQMVKTYIEYAMVVFAAYSGNSAIEKWLVYRAKDTTTDDCDNG